MNANLYTNMNQRPPKRKKICPKNKQSENQYHTLQVRHVQNITIGFQIETRKELITSE